MFSASPSASAEIFHRRAMARSMSAVGSLLAVEGNGIPNFFLYMSLLDLKAKPRWIPL